MKADPASLSHWLIRNGLSFKKSLQASECDRPDVRQAREAWKAERQPKMRTEPQRLVFIDETGTNTKMTRARGRGDKGERLRSKAPLAIGRPRLSSPTGCGALTAPWVIDAPIDRAIFETYVRTQLAPTLQKGDIVILDNLPAHKSSAAQQAIREQGAWLSPSCRPTAPTSIPSKWPSPNSKRTCAP